jgi:hypothetical protein
MSTDHGPQRNPDELTDERAHDANNPSLTRHRPESHREHPSKSQQDAGVAGQGTDEVQPQDVGTDLPGTYEPDKRPSKRTTL